MFDFLSLHIGGKRRTRQNDVCWSMYIHEYARVCVNTYECIYVCIHTYYNILSCLAPPHFDHRMSCLEPSCMWMCVRASMLSVLMGMRLTLCYSRNDGPTWCGGTAKIWIATPPPEQYTKYKGEFELFIFPLFHWNQKIHTKSTLPKIKPETSWVSTK